MLTVFNDDNLLLLESFGTFRLLALLELPETLCSRLFLRLKPQPAISFQNIMIPRALWLLHLQLDRKRSRVNTKWPHEKGFVIQTIKMPKPSRAVRITVLPEVEPMEQSSTLALLLMAFLPAWMALEKIVVTSAVAAGTADSTLHGMPQICLFMALRLSGGSRGKQEGLCSIGAVLAVGQQGVFLITLFLFVPAPQEPFLGRVSASPGMCRMDGWGLVLQAVAQSAHACGTGRMQDIARHQSLTWEFLRG